MNFEKVFEIHDKLYLGLVGLASDILTVRDTLRMKHNMYKLKEERNMKPKTFAHVVSNLLYEKRFGPFFTEPIIAGLDEETNEPFISNMDLIGAMVFTDDFVVAGTPSENLYGMCESLYKPGLEPKELFEVISQAMLSATDRDALSGWGVLVHVITPEGVSSKTLKARMD
jgi:20S proteasome subunit beta 3